jgi:hypothetical protein
LRDYRSSAQAQRTWAYIAGISGLVISAAAVGLYFWNDDRYGDWENERESLDQAYTEKPPFPSDLVDRQDKNDDLIRSIQNWDTISIGALVAGGALLVTGVVLFITSDNPDRYEDISAQARLSGRRIQWTVSW